MLARHVALPVLSIALTFALTACGSGGNSGDEKDQIAIVIREATTGGKPADCKRLETLPFMEQTVQIKGKEALKACEEHLSEVKDNPKAVVVSKVAVEGSGATADVAFTGGGFNGQTATIALVKDGDQWKLDKIEGFAKFNRAKLIEQFETKLADASSAFKKSTVSCFVKKMEKASEAEIEELVLSGSAEPVTQLLEVCS